jgi:hypothetical protein
MTIVGVFLEHWRSLTPMELQGRDQIISLVEGGHRILRYHSSKDDTSSS